nr:helix-turn-helix domain-containing protein [Streptomyces sp. CNQ085]
MAGTAPGTPRVLRAINDRVALELLLAHGSLSRGRVGRLTGLSKPTASQLLTRLEAAGLVRRVASANRGGFQALESALAATRDEVFDISR